METRVLGRRLHFTSPVVSISSVIHRLLILGLICGDSLLLIAAAASVSPYQNHMKFGYNEIEWSNGTDVHPTPVKCLNMQSNRLQNETFGDYRLTTSFGDGIFVFGFIGILIVLKSLLTKIMMVENKPEDSEHVMSVCETTATYKITHQKRPNHNSILKTPPNSPCVGQSLTTSITNTPVFCSGNHFFPLSNLDRENLYYGEKCPFSSPEGSTKCLV